MADTSTTTVTHKTGDTVAKPKADNHEESQTAEHLEHELKEQIDTVRQQLARPEHYEQKIAAESATATTHGPQESQETQDPQNPQSSQESQLLHQIHMPEEALVWMGKLELNNAHFTSELRKRVFEGRMPAQTLSDEEFSLSYDDHNVLSAKWQLLGFYQERDVQGEQADVEGVAPGKYCAWFWPWMIPELADEEPTLTLKAKVQTFEELATLRNGLTFTRNGMVIRYILSVLTNRLGLEHVYTEGAGNAKRAFGLTQIRYGEPLPGAGIADRSTQATDQKVD